VASGGVCPESPKITLTQGIKRQIRLIWKRKKEEKGGKREGNEPASGGDHARVIASFKNPDLRRHKRGRRGEKGKKRKKKKGGQIFPSPPLPPLPARKEKKKGRKEKEIAAIFARSPYKISCPDDLRKRKGKRRDPHLKTTFLGGREKGGKIWFSSSLVSPLPPLSFLSLQGEEKREGGGSRVLKARSIPSAKSLFPLLAKKKGKRGGEEGGGGNRLSAFSTSEKGFKKEGGGGKRRAGSFRSLSFSFRIFHPTGCLQKEERRRGKRGEKKEKVPSLSSTKISSLKHLLKFRRRGEKKEERGGRGGLKFRQKVISNLPALY